VSTLGKIIFWASSGLALAILAWGFLLATKADDYDGSYGFSVLVVCVALTTWVLGFSARRILLSQEAN
jgi:hypothetical protein